jgi:hypothetical protein
MTTRTKRKNPNQPDRELMFRTSQPLGTYFIDYFVEPVRREQFTGADGRPHWKSIFAYYLLAVDTVSRFVYWDLANISSFESFSPGTFDPNFLITEMGPNNVSNFRESMNRIWEQQRRLGAIPMRYIWGDGQSSFNSKRGGVQKWYHDRGITFRSFERQRNWDPSLIDSGTFPNYGQEGLMNRLVRTLRDKAYKKQDDN